MCKNQIINYCTTRYPFKDLFEKLFECKIEDLHFKYDIEDTVHWDAEKYPNAGLDLVYDKIYPFPFQSLYDDFLKNVVKAEIAQRSPSVRVVCSDRKLIYGPTTNGLNTHRDGEAPYSHPVWETNYWVPFIDTDEYNCLIIENEMFKLKYGEMLIFNGNTKKHGTFVHNKSKNTRISMDFRCCKFSDYDTSLLSNVKIKSRGEWFLQNEYFTTEKYYKIVS